jgi:hypothetical protein
MWYFRPSFVNCCPSPRLSGSTLPPSPFPPSSLPCVKKYTVQYTRIKCVWGWGGGYGVLGLRQINTCHKVPLQVQYSARFYHTKHLMSVLNLKLIFDWSMLHVDCANIYRALANLTWAAWLLTMLSQRNILYVYLYGSLLGGMCFVCYTEIISYQCTRACKVLCGWLLHLLGVACALCAVLWTGCCTCWVKRVHCVQCCEQAAAPVECSVCTVCSVVNRLLGLFSVPN